MISTETGAIDRSPYMSFERGEYVKKFEFPNDIYLKVQPVDGRKGLNGLLNVINNEMGKAASDGDLFVFITKKRDKLKLLWYYESCYYLITDWSIKEHFPWPKSEEEARKISKSQFMMLLDRIDCFRSSDLVRLTD